MDILKTVFWFLVTPLFLSFEGGGGGGEEDDKPKGEESEDDETQEDDDKDDKKKGEDKKKKPKTVTRAEHNSTMAKARIQGGEDSIKKLLKDTGFENAEDLVASAKKTKDAEEEAKTDLEKAQSEIETEKQRADEAEATAKETVTTSNLRLMRAEVMVEAVKEDYGIDTTAINDIWGFIINDKKILELIKFDDDGDITGIDKAIEKVLENREYLLAGETDRPIGNKTKKKFKKSKKKGNEDDITEQPVLIGKRKKKLSL